MEGLEINLFDIHLHSAGIGRKHVFPKNDLLYFLLNSLKTFFLDLQKEDSFDMFTLFE